MLESLETSQLVTTLQTAIGPVVVISGVGLILLTMTNRLGRIVDRARLLAHQARTAGGEAEEAAHVQLRILGQRAPLVRWFFIVSMLCLVGSLTMFLLDINKSLHATAVEVGKDWRGK